MVWPQPRGAEIRRLGGALLLVSGMAALISVRMTGHLPAGRAAVPLAALLAFVALSTWITWRAARWTRPDAPAARYVRPAIDDGDAQALLENIEQAFEGQRLFADPGLTLAALAAAVDATPHQVSEALNRVAGVSFRDLLNRRRIDDVKRQLAAADGDRYTIEGIGASAGFRSRSALHAAFHRLEGMTPAAYRTLMRRPPG